MVSLVLGLALFLGMHSASIVALRLRDKLAAKSELGWKALYSIVSIVGIALIVRGYAELRGDLVLLYAPPNGLRYVAALLILPVFPLLLAPYFPGRIARSVGHPQLVAVMLWAVAHLLANGTLADLLLFGSFLAWAVADRLSMRNRPTRRVPAARESVSNDVAVLVIGLGLYAAMLFWLHEIAFGVRPIV